ncbi:MAG: hypothetical protein K2P67_00210 [Gallionellaceae bacterium]|nr:hypothetical protein [Gallionellaceae bacterium]
MDTVLFHQGLSLLFDCGGLHGFATLDPHRGLNSLGDFPVQAGADLHRFSPKITRHSGEFCCRRLYQIMPCYGLFRHFTPAT